MLTVTHKGQTEPLNQIKNFEMQEEVNGALTVTFASFSLANNPGHALLQEESLIELEGYEFRVKQLKESPRAKTVTAISSYFDNSGTIQTDIYGGTHTLSQFLTFALARTGWTFEIQDVTRSVLIPNFGEDNSVKLVQKICEAFECEFQIMPNKHLVFAHEIGPDNDAQYRYRHNVKTINKSVDTSNMKMSITAYGADGLTVKYTSPNATKFPHLGEAESVRDERFTIPENLLEHAKKSLNDYPETSIEVDTVEVTDKELGERVWLIYEPLELEYQTRVMSKKSVLRNGRLVTATATIGNVVPRDLSDILTQQKVEIDENKKETRSKFEQTNEYIRLEVERVDDSIAAVDIKADNIILSVQAVEQSVAAVDIKADNISLSVTQLNGRVNNAESQLTIQAGQIQSKVSQTDYNGNTIASLINQTASTVSISAQAIDLTGIVRVADSVELGHTGNGAAKAIKFNGFDAWIYSAGDFNLTLDASYVRVEGALTATSPIFGRGVPVITGTSGAQALTIGLTPAGVLNVYRPDGSVASFKQA